MYDEETGEPWLRSNGDRGLVNVDHWDATLKVPKGNGKKTDWWFIISIIVLVINWLFWFIVSLGRINPKPLSRGRSMVSAEIRGFRRR